MASTVAMGIVANVRGEVMGRRVQPNHTPERKPVAPDWKAQVV